MAPTFTTNLGLIKPDPLDVIDVAQINANMDTLDTVIGTAQVLPAVPLSTALTSAYPLGTSMVRIIASDISADSGWAVDPGATAAMLVTFKPATDRATQYWYRHTVIAGQQASYMRYITNAGQGPWMRVGGLDHRGTSVSTFPAQTATVPTATWTKIAMSENTDVNQGADIVQSGGGYALNGGLYYLEAMVLWAGGGGAGSRNLGFDFDGAGPTMVNRSAQVVAAGSALTQTVAMTRQFAAGTVFLWAFQDSGGSVQITNRKLYVRKVPSVA